MPNLTKSIVIIRNTDDIPKVSNIIEKIKEKNFTQELIAFHELYSQYAFATDSGMIIAAITNKELSISPLIITEHFVIKNYEIGYNDGGYKVYVYDKESGEILVAQQNDGNIIVTGNILYDSLNT